MKVIMMIPSVFMVCRWFDGVGRGGNKTVSVVLDQGDDRMDNRVDGGGALQAVSGLPLSSCTNTFVVQLQRR